MIATATDTFAELLCKIAHVSLPHSTDIADLEAANISRALAEDRDLNAMYKVGKLQEVELGVGWTQVSMVADLLAVAAATWAVFKTTIRVAKPPSPLADLETLWRSSLITWNVPPETADKIVQEMTEALLQALKRVSER